MRQSLITEQDLERFNENMKRIKGTAVISTCIKGTVPNTAVSKSPYDSKWEEAYHAKLQLELQAGLIKQVWLHPFSLWLPGGVRYKPDFMVQYAMDMGNTLELIEVKGWSKNRRDGITRLKIAAALFPCFVWRMVYKTKGGGWDGVYL